MKVLAIDTSNYPLGIALIDEEKVLGEYITNLKKNHSLRAMPAIQQLLDECEVKQNELTKIVVANGPGSYTGVRIGVTIAKTLAWSLNIPIVPVSSLATVAASGRYFSGLISPIFDARRGQVYTGLYSFKDGILQTVIEDSNLLASEWAEKLKSYNEDILFIGNDVSIHQETLQTVLGGQAYIAAITSHNPRPSELAFLGVSAEGTSVHEVVPNYVRMVEAEVKWLESQKK